ncbi:hypothetical protein F4818DRAFT_206948 [Hypoxylon cercidicola]|nr:hypothetical protein F4818DRAFT_206948 [Hypoxylon cercidicola]
MVYACWDFLFAVTLLELGEWARLLKGFPISSAMHCFMMIDHYLFLCRLYRDVDFDDFIPHPVISNRGEISSILPQMNDSYQAIQLSVQSNRERNLIACL